ncbi:DUF881 domain-containing protein [Falsibacillus albus]|uniref:DUF881 domain-containing protein n=1 Tax=Falsibacillus albus TaxID=2478915 RepID=A0A3L7JYE8_9BACI|nr:DUF881 domain-containing protein [Falsibacillus albus]RLQ95827.1 DUF881 domain-containing protein [Falsibacillus albus]
MAKRVKVSFTLITIIIGFMLAIQFQTVKKPVVRDTRDIWELREALLKEKKLQSNLINEIRSNEEKLDKYEANKKVSKEEALRETLDELKKEAGLTDISGPGIVLTIEPVYEDGLLGKNLKSVSPDLLKRMVNELNMYDAKYISIDNQRVVNNTVIRDINGETKVNGHTVGKVPIEVKIITDDWETAQKLYNRMQVSQSADEFFLDDLRINISKPSKKVKIPGYQDTIRIRYMEPVKEKGEN